MENLSKQSLCRCCLKDDLADGEELLDMNENFFVFNEQQITLAKSYQEVTGCFVAGKLSRMSLDVSKICDSCAVKLQTAYVFRDLSIEANGILELQYESEKKALVEVKQVNLIVSEKATKSRRKPKPAKKETMDPEDLGKFPCPVCFKPYNLKSSLKAHMLFKHENSKNYKYKCSVCSKQCPTTFILKAHMDTHTAEPTHKCHICHNSFRHRTYLLQHLKKHSENMTISFGELKHTQKMMEIREKGAGDDPSSDDFQLGKDPKTPKLIA